MDEFNTNEKKNNIKKEVFSWVKTFALAFVLTMFIVTFVGQLVHVNGHSMENNLQNGDVVICDKISYRFNEPQRFDIVVLFPNTKDSDRLIKRIIALPNETVKIDAEGNIFVNGKILEEDYGKETILYAGLASTEITLEEDEYFCLGDNRNNSTDSRMIGPIKKEFIIGRAFFRLQPVNKIGFLTD